MAQGDETKQEVKYHTLQSPTYKLGWVVQVRYMGVHKMDQFITMPLNTIQIYIKMTNPKCYKDLVHTTIQMEGEKLAIKNKKRRKINNMLKEQKIWRQN